MSKQTIAIWFSCGAASAVAAKLTIDKYGKTHKILIVNNPVKEEHEDNLRFLKDVEKWLNEKYFWYRLFRIRKYKIVEAKCKEYPSASIVDVFEKRKYVSGRLGAPCTMLLKKQARYEFELANKIDWHVLGFTFDEKNRHDKFTMNERANVLPILIEAELTKGNCFDVLIENNIKLPEIYKLGYPNANCIGCVKSQSPTYWNLVRKTFPEVYEQRAEQSRRIGCKLVKRKGERIFLDELKPTDKGGKIKSWECGIFCDTQ